MNRLVLLAGAAVLLFPGQAFPAEAAAPPANATYRTIDYPGASFTQANAVIRTSSLLHPVAVVGTYADIQGSHGFLLSGGQYTKLDVPGALSTTALGINAHYEIVGKYRDALTGQECNYKYSQGTYTHILSPCANGLNHDQVRGINNAGALVGRTCCTLPTHSGFVRTPTASNYRLTVPGAEETEIRGIDNSTVPRMVGHYKDSNSHNHGALFTGVASSTGVSFDFAPGAYNTEATGINDAGHIVGSFSDARNRNWRGFVRGGGQGDRTFSYPGAQLTRVNGISNPDSTGRFNVVGTYLASPFNWHGFIATVSPLVPPGH
jgi:hypothetical protein